MLKSKRIAIVYDWIDKWGGVERVLLTLHQLFPKAVFFTSYFDSKKAFWAKKLKIKTSFIQKLPKFIREKRIFSLPFYPFAFESFNFNDYDLVISVTSSFGKSIITQLKTKHVCYLLTPTRFLWSHQNDYSKRYPLFAKYYIDYLKHWDLLAAQRPDKIISISETVKERGKKYYQRESEVIYPPFDREYWRKIKSQITNYKLQTNSKFQIPNTKFYLLISRLEAYKKVDLVIQSFNRSKNNLVVVGEGTEEKYLKKISGNNILFLSKLTDLELAKLYLNAEALIMPQEEDFGYVSLEAQFFGCPVIAYIKGGAGETVIDGKTGIFFKNQTEKSLKQAIERFDKIKYNLKKECKKFGIENVSRFDRKIFENRFTKAILNLKS